MEVTANSYAARSISPGRVAEMCQYRMPEDVAADLNIPLSEVYRLLDMVPAARSAHVPLIVYDIDTGRRFRARGWRSAYFMAQIRGFANWDWAHAADYRAWQESQA